MKRYIPLLLVCALLASLVGCDSASTTPTTRGPLASTKPTGQPTEPTTEPDDPSAQRYWADYDNHHVVGGQLSLSLSQGGSLEISYNDPYKGTPGSDYSSPHVYTLDEYLTSGQDLNWSPLDWESAEDAYILDYTTMGLYCFTLNSDLTGWTIVPEMAAAAPVDVTAEYEGRYGIQEGETARAWRIALNPQACFSNGEAIDADTYLYSYQQLLERRMANHRAEEVTGGAFAIAGAAAYYEGSGSWEDVGIVKTGEFEIVLITAQPIAQPEFYVPYYLQASYLVYPPLWESCKSYFDAEGNQLSGDCEEAVSVTSTYCTSLKTAISYGPYVLTGFAPGETIQLERNFTWYGYMDGKHLGQYQTDTILCAVYKSYADALSAYQAGLLDRVTLQSGDVEAYFGSGLLRQSQSTYTTKLTFNTDADALAARGTQVLANPNFRNAIALALDRSRFSAAYTAPGLTGLGLINEAYFGDAASGLVYRDTDSAIGILTLLYGQELTGFDLETAQNLMRKAFEECLTKGLYDGLSPITLQLSVYQEDPVYSQIAQFLTEALASACEGSGFAGKITVEVVVDGNCYETMAKGETDMIFSTWGGNAFAPYSILYHCYCSDSRMEYGFDPAALTVEIEINGETFTASLLQWARFCDGEAEAAPVSENGTALSPFRSYDAESQAALFAELEFAYLSQFTVTPLYSRGSAWLVSEQGDYAVKNDLPLVGFGGVRYYTFAYTDIEWNALNP